MAGNEQKIRVLLTGSNGQLGKWLTKILEEDTRIVLKISDIETLDITDKAEVLDFVGHFKPDYIINAAAYTAVELAESEKEITYKINAEGPANLSNACKRFNTSLIHISTDYVYNGLGDDSLKEDDPTTPNGVYAESKLAGEQMIRKTCSRFYIIRTGWLYSEFGHNFVKTIRKLGKKGSELKVVDDQIGAPTYAKDLAEVVKKIIISEAALPEHQRHFGVYNYSNKGEISWFQFAHKILELSGFKNKVKAIPSSAYKTVAPRPKNSRLNTEKITSTFKVEIPGWEEALLECIENM